MSNQSKTRIITVPNILTAFRIVGSLCLLFFRPPSLSFYILYSLCGFSDVLDGWIARSTGTTSELGAKLDSIADLLFYFVMVMGIMPVLIDILPVWLWAATGVVVLLRLASYLTAAIKYGRFASMHTYMNKVTGAAMFTMPYCLLAPCAVALCAVICLIAGLSSLEELIIHLVRREYNSGVKTIFDIRK